MTSPSVRSIGKPPTNIQALSLYMLCHDFVVPAIPSSISLSLNFFRFSAFLKYSNHKMNTYLLYRESSRFLRLL